MANFLGYYIHQSNRSSLLALFLDEMNIYKSLLLTILIITLACLKTPARNDFSTPFQTCWEITLEKEFYIASDNVSVKSSIESNGNLLTRNRNFLIVYNNSGEITAIDSEDGEKLWESYLGGTISRKPILSEEDLFVITEIGKDSATQVESNITQKRILRSVSALTGITKWEKEIEIGNEFIYFPDKNLITFLTDELQEISYDTVNGDLVAKQNFKIADTSLPSKFPIHTLKDRVEFFAEILPSSKNRKYLEGLWNNPGLTALSAGKSVVFWADKRGRITAFDSVTGRNAWEMRFGGAITTLNVLDQGLLVASLDNFLYLLDRKNGKVLWKRRFSGRITDSPGIVGESALVNVYGESSVFFINLKDGKIFNRIDLRDDLVTGEPFPVDNLIIVPSSRKLTAFASGKCPSEL